MSWAGVTLREGFGPDGPDGGHPGQTGASAPLMGHVDPEAGADGLLDVARGLRVRAGQGRR